MTTSTGCVSSVLYIHNIHRQRYGPRERVYMKCMAAHINIQMGVSGLVDWGKGVHVVFALTLLSGQMTINRPRSSSLMTMKHAVPPLRI
jgi:hypothetical protein